MHHIMSTPFCTAYIRPRASQKKNGFAKWPDLQSPLSCSCPQHHLYPCFVQIYTVSPLSCATLRPPSLAVVPSEFACLRCFGVPVVCTVWDGHRLRFWAGSLLTVWGVPKQNDRTRTHRLAVACAESAGQRLFREPWPRLAQRRSDMQIRLHSWRVRVHTK